MTPANREPVTMADLARAARRLVDDSKRGAPPRDRVPSRGQQSR